MVKWYDAAERRGRKIQRFSGIDRLNRKTTVARQRSAYARCCSFCPMVKWYHTALWRRGSWFESRSGSGSTRSPRKQGGLAHPLSQLRRTIRARPRVAVPGDVDKDNRMELGWGTTQDLNRRFEEHASEFSANNESSAD